MVGMKTRAPLPPVLRQAGKSRVVFISGPKTRGQPATEREKAARCKNPYPPYPLADFLLNSLLYSTYILLLPGVIGEGISKRSA